MDNFKLIHPCGITISQTTTESEVRDHTELGNTLGSYYFEIANILDRKVKVSLYFNNNQLERVVIFLSDLKYGIGWDVWSQKKELQRTSDTKTFLGELGYPPKKYSWGYVWAGYDSEKRLGLGTITFKPE